MRLRVDFQGGSLEFESVPEKLIAAWEGPVDAPADNLEERIRSALECPLDFPPLRQVVVPGDKVVVPLDLSLPCSSAVLEILAIILHQVGVETITAIIDGRQPGLGELALPDGVSLEVHDPTERKTLAYLATTEAGRRIYLNHLVAEADCVIPVGRMGFDETFDLRGPWSVIEPGLGDTNYPPASLLASAKTHEVAAKESTEVSWLLGSLFQVAGIPGRSGLLHLFAGETAATRARGKAVLNESWLFQLEDRADLVIAGIGGPGRVVSPNDFLDGLRSSLRAVNRGGRVAILTQLNLGQIREAFYQTGLPRGDLERALAWADIYLMSGADSDAVESLGMIGFERPEQASKLVTSAHSLVTISQADRTRVELLS